MDERIENVGQGIADEKTREARRIVEGVAVTPIAIVVDDASVDCRIEELCEKLPGDPVEGAVRLGDVATVSYRGAFEDGSVAVPPAAGEVVLGSGVLVPGFESAVVGKRVGEPFEFSLTYPAAFSDERLEGKAIRFRATVVSATRRFSRVLDDACVQDISEFSSVAELREAIADQLRAEAAQEERRYAEGQVKRQIAERVIASGWRVAPAAATQGAQGAGASEGAHGARDARDEDPASGGAIDEARVEAVFSGAAPTLAAALGIEAGGADIDAEIVALSAESGLSEDDVRGLLSEEGRMDVVRAAIVASKLVDYALGTAQVEDAEGADVAIGVAAGADASDAAAAENAADQESEAEGGSR